MTRRISPIAVSLAGLAVLLQIAWPLADTSGRVVLTTLSVIAFDVKRGISSAQLVALVTLGSLEAPCSRT